MPVDTLDKLVAALGTKQQRPFNKVLATAVSGQWSSLWTMPGQPGAGSAPPAYTAGSGYVPTDATTGAFPFTNPTGPAVSYLVGLGGTLVQAGAAFLYDRLWACSGMVGNSASAQTVTTPGSLTRPDANGENVELWLETYTAFTPTAATLTVSYTNQDGTSGRSATLAFGASSVIAGRMFQLNLQAGDTGVRSIQSATWGSAGSVAGNFGLTLLRRVIDFNAVAAGMGQTIGPFDTRMGRIYDDACLALAQCPTAAAGGTYGSFDIGQG